MKTSQPLDMCDCSVQHVQPTTEKSRNFHTIRAGSPHYVCDGKSVLQRVHKGGGREYCHPPDCSTKLHSGG